MSVSRLKAAIERGGPVFGAWCTLSCAAAAEIASWEAVDYVCIDLQHGAGSLDTLVPMLMAAGGAAAGPIVRVLDNDFGQIGKALDGGAEGVIVPLVNSGDDAARAAAACRYPPEGTRSHGPFRAARYLNANPHSTVNREVVCLVMVETVEGVDHLDEICSTPGVDGVYVGPNDLAVNMGFSPGFEELPAAHAEAIERIRQRAKAHGLVVGIHCADGMTARTYADRGFDMVTVSTDSMLLRKALRDEVALARGVEHR
jgi:4-hydroxy-2-oxoheptanedioate aldolase